MDHCPLPPGKGHIKVRNLTTTPYTTGDEHFMGYPARRGWSSNDLNFHGPHKARQIEEVRDFYQGWLFFGCVIEFLSICNIRAQHSDFLTEDGQYVTTKLLPEMLGKWERIARKRLKNIPLLIATTMQAALIVGVVRDFVDDYCLPRNSGQPLSSDMRVRLVARSPLPQRVWMSIIALGHALTSVMVSSCDIRRTGSRWGGSMVLEQRMLAKKWCPSDIRRVLCNPGMTVYEQYYLSKAINLESVGSKDDRDKTITHQDCTEFECRGRNVDETSYHQSHARSCDGKCGGFQRADIDQLTTIIKAGEIPVFRWNHESKKLELDAVKVNDRKIAYPPFMAISHVWSDGMGNPNDNAIYLCQLEALQKSVGSAAGKHKMLLGIPSHFWIDTLCVPVQKENKELRKKCIRDMGRIYESSCAVLVLGSLTKISTSVKGPERRVAEHFNNWDRRLWTFQECVMARKRLIQYADKTVDHVSIEADFYRDKLCYGDSPADPLPPLVSAIASRSTSKKSDETLCLATIMRLDIEPFLNAEKLLRNAKRLSEEEEISDTDLADQRMQIFWQTIRGYQWQGLFNSHRRLSMDGLRWAPATFLGSPPEGFVREADEHYCDLDKEGRGLTFTAGGIFIEIPSPWKATSQSLMIEVADLTAGEVCIAIEPNDLSFPSQRFRWIPGTKYAIILEKPLSPGLPSRSNTSRAQFPATRSDLQTWLEQVFQPGRLNQITIDGIVATVINENLEGACQIRHECIATAKIVDSSILSEREQKKFTMWNTNSRLLLDLMMQPESMPGQLNRDDAHEHYDDSSVKSDDNEWEDVDEDEDDDEEGHEDDNSNKSSDGSLPRSNNNTRTYYYDDSDLEADPTGGSEAPSLYLDNDILDSGSESADEHPYQGSDQRTSPPLPARIQGIGTRDDARWFLL